MCTHARFRSFRFPPIEDAAGRHASLTLLNLAAIPPFPLDRVSVPVAAGLTSKAGEVSASCNAKPGRLRLHSSGIGVVVLSVSDSNTRY